MSRIIVTSATVEKPGTATPPISNGVVQAFRLPTEDVLTEDHESFDNLKAAMAKHPDLPWAQISVFGGEPIEPELLEVINVATSRL
jgi:hypothetical protein